MTHHRILSFAAFAALTAASQAAVTFSNFTYGPGAVVAGFGTGPTINGNSLTWQPGNATVVEGVVIGQASPVLTIALTYDATSTAPVTSVFGSVGSLSQGFVGGSGLIQFREDIFALDGNGNEIGYLGGVSQSTAGTGTLDPVTISLSSNASSIRVKKSFVLTAFNTSAAADFATLAQVNQSVNVVPEPASMAALGLGALGLLRRRKKA